ncbi:hypothetical protein BH24BAC1_BH24BAC1_05990 [soil metagenome]
MVNPISLFTPAPVCFRSFCQWLVFLLPGGRGLRGGQRGKRRGTGAILLPVCFALFSWPAIAQEVLPPVTNPKNQLSADWLIYQPAQNQLQPFLNGYHPARNALYQWVNLRSDQPFRVTFKAKKDLCLFLDNQLLFTADSSAVYTVDLVEKLQVAGPKMGKALLCVWHPTDQPDYSSFENAREAPVAEAADAPSWALVNLVREDRSQNVFILVLLLIGLVYGGLKVSFPSDFSSLFRLSNFMRTSTLEEGALAKPIRSWSILFFIMAFSLSFSLLIVAIHTDVQQIYLFNRLFSFSDADIVSRIVFYSSLTFLFIILKYVFLRVMGFIFDLSNLVQTQYREFVRSTLFMGLSLPAIMLLYLTLNASIPTTVLLISNAAVSVLLIITSLRIFRTLNKKTSLLNLHLFSYICATEIIPLVIILKLVVFSYQ